MGKKPLYFGEYLLRKGLIEEKDILVARYVQQQANKQIGQLALKQKLLTAQKVREILQQQHKKKSRKFGEIAIDLKILTRNQVKDLITYQEKHNFLIGEIFTYEGKFTRQQIEEEIRQFSTYRESRKSETENDKEE